MAHIAMIGLVASLGVILPVGTGCGAQSVPTVAAEVGGEPISGQEVERLSRTLRDAEPSPKGQANAQGRGHSRLSSRRLRQLVLSQLVRATLVAQLARQEGVNVPAGELATSAAAEFSAAEFAGTGWEKSDFETAVRSSMLSKALAEKLFPSVTVPESKARSYFNAHPEQFDARWQATVDLAFFEHEAKAKELANSPPGPGRFPDLAHQFGAAKVIDGQSVDPSSPLPAEILDAVAAMDPGSVRGPLPVPKGYWVVHARDVTHLGPQPFESVRPMVEAHLTDQERQARFSAWFEGKLRSATIKVHRRYGHWPDDFVL